MRFSELIIRNPFSVAFALAYVGVVTPDVLWSLIFMTTSAVPLFVLRLREFLPLISLVPVFHLYAESLSRSGPFVVGRVDSLSPGSVLVAVEGVKEDLRSSWKKAGGYVRIFGSDDIRELEVYDRVFFFCPGIREIRRGWRFCGRPVFVEKVGVEHGFVSFLRKRARDLLRTDDERDAVVDSILFGGREEIDQRFLYDLSRFGVLHLVAISGSHFTAVAFLGVLFADIISLYFLRGFFSVRFQPFVLKIFFSILFQFLFLLICGAVRPAQRAFVMNAIFFTSYLSGRSFSPTNALFASAFIIVSLNPFDIWNISFVLSFLAVFFLLSFIPSGGGKLSKIFWSSVFASLGTLPVSVWLGIPVSLVSPLTNIVFTALFNGVIAFGVAGVFLGMLFEPLAEIPIALARFLVGLIILIVDAMGFLAISVRPKVNIPYELVVVVLFAFLSIIRRWRFFVHASLAVYIILPVFLNLFSREKVHALSVFLVREVRVVDGTEFFVLPLRENISDSQLERLFGFLRKRDARCVTLCFSSAIELEGFRSCDDWHKCDFGNIRN